MDAASVVLAVTSLGTDITYNEADKRRTILQHEAEMACAREFHKAELEAARAQHKESIELAKIQHEREYLLAKNVHKNDLTLAKQTHLMSTFAEMEIHFAQLDADLTNATKEAERDMYDQYNQQLQTLILASSVMIAALTTLLIQGILPQGSNPVLTIAFGASCGLSFALLFACLVLCIEILRLGSKFMVKRAKSTGKFIRGTEPTVVGRPPAMIQPRN